MTESDDARKPRDARVASTPMGSNRLPSDAFSTLIEAATARVPRRAMIPRGAPMKTKMMHAAGME